MQKKKKKSLDFFSLYQGLADGNHSWDKAGLLPVFVSKVFLDHSHANSFTYCQWLLSATMTILNSCEREYMSVKA